MRRFFLDNLGWKVLSVGLAFLLWIAVAREPELATSISVPVLFKNIPDDLDIASDVPERVHLEIRGPAPRLTPESLAQTAAVLDLKDLQAGEQTFTLNDSSIRQLPMGVSFYRAVPSQIALRFERLYSKDVPIEPRYAKAAPQGYSVVGYRFDPPKVRIRGPEQRLQTIDHVTTDPIDLSGLVSQTSQRVRVRIGEPRVRLESNAQVRITLELRKLPPKESQ